MLISLSTHCGCRAAFPTWAVIIPFLQWWGGRKHWAGKVNSHVCGYAVCNHRQVTSPPCPPALFICFDTLWSTDCLFPGQPWCGFPLMATLILWEEPEGSVWVFLPCWMSPCREEAAQVRERLKPQLLCSAPQSKSRRCHVKIEPFATQQAPGNCVKCTFCFIL